MGRGRCDDGSKIGTDEPPVSVSEVVEATERPGAAGGHQGVSSRPKDIYGEEVQTSQDLEEYLLTSGRYSGESMV